MGEHLDSRPPTAGPLDGHTFIYGAYGGEIIFMEPMLTKVFLEGLRTAEPHRVCAPVPQPAPGGSRAGTRPATAWPTGPPTTTTRSH
ncbi:hypothetical protein DN402_04325 [Streptomyces sp. SW4]|nr:hypothetical protein DN402_04325 [Streptomyces sp. SW4]